MAGFAFAEDDDTITGEYKYGASLEFSGNADPSRSFCYSDSYFRHSGYEYDHALAEMTMDLACSADASMEVDWSQSNKNFIDLMQKCGFVSIDANAFITGGSTRDSIGVNMASKPIDDYTLLAVAVRGHNYASEWSSNFKVGKYGDHQGFAEARDQVLANILPILNAHFPEIGRVWLDVTPADYFLAQNRAAVARSHVHAIDTEKYHAAQPATCTEAGTVEYYECTESTCSAKLDANAQVLEDITDENTPAAGHSFAAEWTTDKKEHWHAAACGHNDQRDAVGKHTDGNDDMQCDICGAEIYSVKLTVSTTVHRTLLLKIAASCTYELRPVITGATVQKVQYSLDGGLIWFTGTSFTAASQKLSFRVRILDSTGAWTCFTVKNGTNVTNNLTSSRILSGLPAEILG